MKAVIFDMDGVIIDSEPMHYEIEIGLLRELGGDITDEEHEKFVGRTDEYMWSTFKKQFNIDKSVEEMINIKKERFNDNIENINLVPGFKEFVELIHDAGYEIGLASSNNMEAINKVVETFGLDKYLTFHISGEEVEEGKPNPEIFLKCAEKLKVKPEECLVLEDANSGVEAAKKAKMKCIGLQNPNSGNQDLSKADLIVDSLYELNLDVVKELFD